MNSLKLNRWYVSNNELSIIFMRFYVSINLLSGPNGLYFELKVYDSAQKELSLVFKTLEEATFFAEEYISKCKDFSEIIESYKNSIIKKLKI